ncbi:hypothetical protein ACFL4Q_04050 [candidate division KSB1 bacterium]
MAVVFPPRNIVITFFNPTYLPSLLARMSICVALAGIYALITGSFVKQERTRIRLMRYAGLWAFTGSLTALPSYGYYYRLLPLDANEILAGTMPTSLTAAQILAWAGIDRTHADTCILSPEISPRLLLVFCSYRLNDLRCFRICSRISAETIRHLRIHVRERFKTGRVCNNQ